MTAEILDPLSEPDSIPAAARILKEGGLVVYPTDTVYGVAASVDRPDAVGRLFVAKGRPLERPIPVLVSGIESVSRLVKRIDDNSHKLMDRCWPGPLTIVIPAEDWIPEEIVRSTGSVGVRMPDHPIALELIERSGGALATTSANRSGALETVTADEAAAQLAEHVEVIIDGGKTPGGVPSSVIRVESDGQLTLLRKGALSLEELERTLELAR